MRIERFAIDANVLVYGVDATEPRRQARALDVVAAAAATHRCVLSVQVIGELFVVVRRRRLIPDAALADKAIDYCRLFEVVGVRPEDAVQALPEAAVGGLSYWDALLLATVARAGCTALLSEDMQDGFALGGVTVRNPFVGDALPERVAALLAA